MPSKKKEVRVAFANLKEFIKKLNQFRDLRLNTLRQLKNLLAEAKKREKLKHHGRNTQIAVVSGSTAGIAGGILAVVGFGLSFVTFGTSLILTAVGAAVGGAGGATVAGTRVTSYFLNRKLMKEVKKAIDKDKEASKKLVDSYNKTLSSLKMVKQTGKLEDLLEEVKNSPVKDGMIVLMNLRGMYKGVKTSAAIGRGVVAGADAAVDASGNVLKTLSTAGRVFHIIGVVGAGISLLIDFTTLYTELKRVRKGTTALEEKIECFIKKLHISDDFVDQCLKEVTQEAF